MFTRPLFCLCCGLLLGATHAQTYRAPASGYHSRWGEADSALQGRNLGLKLATLDGQRIMVYRVQSGSCAEAAGLRGGDLLLSIAGQPVQDYADAVQRLRGFVDAPLSVTVRRGAQELQFTLLVGTSSGPKG